MSDLHKEYHDLAEKSLAKGRLDVEAYLVKCVSEIHKAVMTNNNNLPELPINAASLAAADKQDKLSIYLNSKTNQNLKAYLEETKQILSEVYRTCENQTQRNICKEMFALIGKL